MDARLKVSPLREYLDSNVKESIESSKYYYYEKNYTTLSSLKDSIKLVFKNKLGTVEITHKQNGMLIGNEAKKKPNFVEGYFTNEYKTYEFDEKRISSFRKLKTLCNKNNIKLIVSISPMNEKHFFTLISNENLYAKLFSFKKIVVEIFKEVYDFNNLGAVEYKYPYWNDSVHPSVELPKTMIKIIFNKINVTNDFGIKITNKNIDNYLKRLNTSCQILLSEKI